RPADGDDGGRWPVHDHRGADCGYHPSRHSSAGRFLGLLGCRCRSWVELAWLESFERWSARSYAVAQPPLMPPIRPRRGSLLTASTRAPRSAISSSTTATAA